MKCFFRYICEITLRLKLLVQMPCWNALQPASNEGLFECGWCADVWVSCSLFHPISFSVYCACCCSRTLCNACESIWRSAIETGWVFRSDCRNEKNLWKTLVTKDTEQEEEFAVRVVERSMIQRLQLDITFLTKNLNWFFLFKGY